MVREVGLVFEAGEGQRIDIYRRDRRGLEIPFWDVEGWR